MKRSMLSRLMLTFAAILLVLVCALFSMLYFTVRNERLTNKLDEMKLQARDMSYLAASLQSESYYRLSSSSSTATREFLNQKSEQILNAFGAYTLTVSRDGTANAYYTNDDDLTKAASLIPSMDTLSAYISRATQGEQVIETQKSDGSVTIAVPWTQTNSLSKTITVMGVVLLEAPASTLHASEQRLLWETVASACGVFLVSMLIVFIAAYLLTKPLSDAAGVSAAFAKGDFSVRAAGKGCREVQVLADSFNQMADDLATSEQSRKDFIANISHEVRSPITSIHGFANGMLDGTVAKEDYPKYLNIIVSETNRLSALINSMLNLSRMERQDVALALSDFDINELVRRTIISKIPQLEEKSMELEPVFETESCFVRADLEQIQQVLINLLDNAIKYTPENGSITITTETRENTVHLHVKDNGIGILPEDANHIFERFYKADKAHTVGKGTGLGLAICKIIMEKHGQTIRLVSGEHGADFEITLEAGKAPEGKKNYDH